MSIENQIADHCDEDEAYCPCGSTMTFDDLRHEVLVCDVCEPAPRRCVHGQRALRVGPGDALLDLGAIGEDRLQQQS